MSSEAAAPDYWSSYYGGEGVPSLPSQFALFVANEIATGQLGAADAIIDLGCGNGRDALFFLQLGHNVVGLDRSATALARCEAKRASLGEEAGLRGSFVAGCAEDPAQWESLAGAAQGRLIIYSRFFFHAIE